MDKKHPLYGMAPSQWQHNDGLQFMKDFLELEARISTLENLLGFRSIQHVVRATQSPTVSEFMELSHHEYTVKEIADATGTSILGVIRTIRRLRIEDLVSERTDSNTGESYFSFKREEG